MSNNEASGIPPWDLGDRLRKALRSRGISNQAMADHLEVDRRTISNYPNNRTQPNGATLRVWALRCGVPYEWLLRGTEGPEGGPDQGSGGSGWFHPNAPRGTRAA